MVNQWGLGIGIGDDFQDCDLYSLINKNTNIARYFEELLKKLLRNSRWNFPSYLCRSSMMILTIYKEILRVIPGRTCQRKSLATSNTTYAITWNFLNLRLHRVKFCTELLFYSNIFIGTVYYTYFKTKCTSSYDLFVNTVIFPKDKDIK